MPGPMTASRYLKSRGLKRDCPEHRRCHNSPQGRLTLFEIAGTELPLSIVFQGARRRLTLFEIAGTETNVDRALQGLAASRYLKSRGLKLGVRDMAPPHVVAIAGSRTYKSICSRLTLFEIAGTETRNSRAGIGFAIYRLTLFEIAGTET